MSAKKPFRLDYRQDPNGSGSSHQWRAAFQERIGEGTSRRIVRSDAPHAVLGIPLTATWEEIRKAYRRLVKQHHPDRQESTAEDAAKFR